MTEIIVENTTHLDSHPLIESLKKDFVLYKGQGCNISSLGRDGDYRWPVICKEEEVWHIHLIALDSPKRRIHNQYDRTSDDAHLVYCRGYTHRNRYLFIDILSPHAHKKANQMGIMLEIGVVAAEFRRIN